MITINCDGICCEQKFVVDAPENWITSYAEYGGENNTVFCPACAPQNEWFRAVCPGCVSGFPDCGLGKSFMYADSFNLDGAQMSTIESGRCPFRVNGTMTFTAGAEMQSLDISEKAAVGTGIAVLDAIQAYHDENS